MVLFDDDTSNVIVLFSGQVGGVEVSKELLPSILEQIGTKPINVKVSFDIVEHGIGIRKGDNQELQKPGVWPR